MNDATRQEAWYRNWTASEPTDAPEGDTLFHVKHDDDPEPGVDAEAQPDTAMPTTTGTNMQVSAPTTAPMAAPGPSTDEPIDLDTDEVAVESGDVSLVLPEPEPANDGDPDPHFSQARIITIANQKGGVGKTTTAVSLSAALAERGSRVLLVDLDPQGNATSGLGVRVQSGQPTVYQVLVEGADIVDAIEPTNVRNLFVVPSNLDLAGAEIELVSAFSREHRLRKALDSVRADFDVILVDCPPTLGLLTVNALTAGDGIVVPIQCEYYALEGLGALRRNAELIREQLNPALEVVGYLLTMLDARTRLSQQVVDEVESHFGEQVFQTRIPRSVRLAEAPGFGQPINIFDPTSRAALSYGRLAKEVLQRLHVLYPHLSVSDSAPDSPPATQGVDQ